MNAPAPSSKLQSRLTCVIVFSLNKCTSSLSDLLFWLETSSSELEVGGGSYPEVEEAVRTSRSVNFFVPNGKNLSPATLRVATHIEVSDTQRYSFQVGQKHETEFMQVVLDFLKLRGTPPIQS